MKIRIFNFLMLCFILSSSVLTAQIQNGDGLTGYYYQNFDTTGGIIHFENLNLAFSRIDTTFDLWDGSAYYGWNPVSGWTNHYSVHWIGYIYIEDPGQYGFGTISDDGSQVFIDSALIVDNSELQWYDWEDNISEGDPDDTTAASFPPLVLETGFHSISVRFYENASYDGIELWWLKPGVDSSDIPYYGTNFHGTAPTYNPNTNWELVPKSVLFTEIDTSAVSIGYPDQNQFPDKIQLYQNYPNPFNPKTTIQYSIGANHDSPLQHIDLSIFNILGQKVCTLISGKKAAGTYMVTWDAARYPGGVYFYKLSTGSGYEQTKKLILLK
ncbi:MAG: T9SS type A sorting domain-containing protein [Calditrichaceae bacterium]